MALRFTLMARFALMAALAVAIFTLALTAPAGTQAGVKASFSRTDAPAPASARAD